MKGNLNNGRQMGKRALSREWEKPRVKSWVASATCRTALETRTAVDALGAKAQVKSFRRSLTTGKNYYLLFVVV